MDSPESPDQGSLIGSIDPRKADALYKPFPPFAEWVRCVVDTVRYDRYSADLAKLRDQSPDRLRRALDIVKRAAAVDTGAIEGLYETDRGFTFTIAMQIAHWETALAEKGPNVRALFESQLNAYDYVLDFATQRVPIAEAWIRELHAQVCRSQDTYQVLTEIGWQEHPLPKGEYKHLPNHVLQADGQVHSHAPVDMTGAEMFRLCEEVRSELFQKAHPVLQASYAHYALVVIHPFADGNGRTARALGSVFTYRSQSVPLLVLVDTKRDYLRSLQSADKGENQTFVDFILERSIDAIQLAEGSICAAATPGIEESLEGFKQLYVTKGGYTQREVDDAGEKLFEIFQQQLARRIRGVSIDGVLSADVSETGQNQLPKSPKYRLPATQPAHNWRVIITATAPANAGYAATFSLEIPKDCGQEDDLVVRWLDRDESLEARITELIPGATTVLQMRISIWVERIIGYLLDKLYRSAAESLESKK